MGDLFGKQLRKQTARAKEKLLEGLGKAKASQDDVFDQHAVNLSKQAKACERFYRDIKNYGLALKTMVQTQKTLRETIRDLYESEWPDREHLCATTESLDLQWDEFERIINEQLMSSVNAYMAQFPDLRAKVAKRGRKLVDYDGARNNYSAIKASSKKGDDDPKVLKAGLDLQQAETMYKDLNKELIDALPAAYDSRIMFFVDSLQTLFNAESANHTECGRYNKSLVNLLDNLGNSFDSLRVPRLDNSVSETTLEIEEPQNESNSLKAKAETPTPAPRQLSPRDSTTSLTSKEEAVEGTVEARMYPTLNESPKVDNKNGKKFEHLAEVGDQLEKGSKSSLNPFEDDDDEDSFENPDDEDKMATDDVKDEVPAATQRSSQKASDDELAINDNGSDRKILRKVRATHRYAAEDTDELTFDAGEVIAVLESRDEDLLDDGWLLGVKQSDGVRGVFPANFTKVL